MNDFVLMIIFGARSPLVVEIEETCARSDLYIQAIVNLGGVSRVLNNEKVIPVAACKTTMKPDGFIPCAFVPKRRRELVQIAKSYGWNLLPALVDPTAIIASSTRLGRGVFVNAGSIIGAVTMIREGAFINRSSSIGHHCLIGAYASLGPGCILASNITIEEDVIVGAGVVIMPDINIGQGAVISAGTTVSRNIPDGALVTGERQKIIVNGARRIILGRGRTE